MNTPAPVVEPATKVSDAHPRRDLAVALAVNLVAPLAVFYGLRAAGVDQWLALVLGVIPPGIRAVQTIVTRRRIDPLAVFALGILVISVAVSFVAGGPRLLLAKDGWMTGVAGIGILATLLWTPFYFHAIRSFTPSATRERAEAAWHESPSFRHVMRVATAIWGVGLVLDAGVRVVLAYSLPIDSVPLISGLQYVVVFVALEVSSQLYVRRKAGPDLAAKPAEREPA